MLYCVTGKNVKTINVKTGEEDSCSGGYEFCARGRIGQALLDCTERLKLRRNSSASRFRIYSM